MIEMFTKILPYALILFLLYKAQKEPIFFLGIPFLMFIRNSIFFNEVEIFYQPTGLGTDLSLLVWLLIFWPFGTQRIYLNKRKVRKLRSQLSFTILDFIVLSFLLLTVIGLMNASREYFVTKDFMIEFFVLCALPFGYFIMKDFVLSNSLESLRNFLRVLMLINSLGAVLYILHQGLHITIYHGVEYMEETFEGQTITRTFWFMPVLFPFSVAYLMIFEDRKSLFFMGLMAVNLLAIFVTYTRSLLMNSVFVVILYFVFTGFKSKQIMSVLKNLFVIGVIGVLSLVAVKVMLPVSSNYFFSRFSELKQQPNDEESNSMIYRFNKTQEMLSKISLDKKLLGVGPVTTNQNYLVSSMTATTADLVWTGVFFRWGTVGFIILILLHVFAIYKAWELFLNREGLLAQLALLSLLIIISQIIEGFASYTFLKPNGFALNLWYFGMLSALIVYPDEILVKQKV